MLRLIIAAVIFQLVLVWPVATEDEVTEVRDRRYCEIFVIRRSGLRLEGDVFNTLGLNDCPATQWAAIDQAKLKAEYGAVAIVMNGPRHFMMDRIDIVKPGQSPVDFQGLQMNLVAVLHIPWGDIVDRVPYAELKVSRSTRFSFDGGLPVYELISPSGDTYVMQSYSEIVDPNQRMADLEDLGSRLKLPQGWTFRTQVLPAPLTVVAAGEARIVQDELQNTYQFYPSTP
jgi:hypothetical protein